MSSYMLLIIEPPAQRATRTEAQGRAAYAQMQAFGERLRQQGKLQSGAALASQSKAVRVSGVNGNGRVLDGPFSEAKEMVGGFFMVDCASLDEAVALAHLCPAAEWATVEVRALAPCYDDIQA